MRPLQAAPVNKNSKQHKTKFSFVKKIVCPSDAPGLTVIKLVNELFSNALDYQNYVLINKLA